ncbi:thiamine-phosphate kinase [Candidatus Vallotia cooleyia]|uniref:thiamine-phosphate kinase n=1 Tax=Candidatus Vallotiella adelgis TaxID=1177211 RepID=UPI001D0063C9|nr:thiamine-phosphate kinase [Candidatus Vallotia cooleyia]
MPTSLSEFSFIDRYSSCRDGKLHCGTVLGIGDDCALLTGRPEHELAVSTDMLIEGCHFFANVPPTTLGHKALAVNLSDLAAMGAEPRAFTLALALPDVHSARQNWLDAFAHGLFALAERHGCELVGGDTTSGPLNICITVFGDVPCGQALRRDAAKPGDDIWVSGTLGDARLALGALRNEWPLAADELPALCHALQMPEPRIALGIALRGVAHAALDLSDGLAGDLAHILKRSNVTACVDIDALPRSATLRAQPLSIQHRCIIEGGDDYELCFTAPPSRRNTLLELAVHIGVPLTRIGIIYTLGHLSTDTDNAAAIDPHTVRWYDASGASISKTWRSFDHFYKA